MGESGKKADPDYRALVQDVVSGSEHGIERTNPAPNPSSRADRDARGHYLPGHGVPGPGRRPGRTLSAALRDLADPDEIAAQLIGVITDPHTSNRDRVEAIKLFADRVEGKAVARTVVARVGVADLLPPGFSSLPPDARGAILDNLRHRALTGQPLGLAPGQPLPVTDEDT